MAQSNYTQSNFLGGEWSPFSLGRIDDPAYVTSMQLCLNSIPIEEGAVARRPGFIDLGITHKGLPGIIRTFEAGGKFGPIGSTHVGNSFVYAIECTVDATAGYVRLWVPQDNGYPTLLCDPSPPTITSFSSATPTLMTVTPAQASWVTGDTIFVTVNSGAATNGAAVDGRQFVITKVSTTTFTLADAMTGVSIVGSGLVYTTGTASAKRITVLPTTQFTLVNELPTLRLKQSGNNVLFFNWDKSPWLLSISQADAPVVTFVEADFKEADGPYIDALPGTSQTLNKTATATTSDGLTYRVTIGSDGTAYSFVSTDVGRCFRIWTQPAAWAAGTYAAGDTVTYNGNFWTCLTSSTTAAPGQPQAVAGVQTYPWVLSPTLGRWTSAYISAYVSASVVDVHISFNETTSPLLRLTIDTWQIGLFTPGVVGGNAACGGWFDGRLVLGGTPNRFDLSMPGAFDNFVARKTPLFSPTDLNGNVFDDSAIAETFYSDDRDVILWFAPDKQGILVGTADGIWVLSGADVGDAITPTNIKFRKASAEKASFAEPSHVGKGLVFLQAAGRRVYEYVVDALSNRFTARPLNLRATHLADQNLGIQEMVYQEDPAPIVWACTGYITPTGSATGGRVAGDVLLGCTYRRFSDFATVAPEFNGWHQHTHGAGRHFFSLGITTVLNGLDALIVTTYDTTQTGWTPDTNQPLYRVEVMSRMWGPA